MKRTAQMIEEHKAIVAPVGRRKRKPRGKPFPKGNKCGHKFKPGESGNPSGKPGTDLAALAARRLFQDAGEGQLPNIPKGFNAYAFSVLADRGYGKVKDTLTVTGEDGGPVEIRVKLVKPKKES